MKKTFFLFVTLVVSFQVYAQKLKEGLVEFEITYPEMTSDMKDMEGMLPKAMTVFFKNEKSRAEMQTVMGTTVNIGNSITKESILLLDMMGKKIAMKINEDSLMNDPKGLKNAYPDLKITQTTETKMIAGYTCRKAIVTYTESGKPEHIDCFYTDELPMMSLGSDRKMFKGIKGFLMEFSMKQGGMTMKIKAKTISSKKVSDDKFMVPSDYQVVTQEQLQEVMMGGSDEKK
ncbi:MAG: DUF4412 domain-containing protein [Bacteroidia bacterium]